MCIVPSTIPSRRHSHRPRLSINFHLLNNTNNNNNNNNNRYLEVADWILKDAVRSAREDNEWEQEK
jgi:hypothetical protein